VLEITPYLGVRKGRIAGLRWAGIADMLQVCQKMTRMTQKRARQSGLGWTRFYARPQKCRASLRQTMRSVVNKYSAFIALGLASITFFTSSARKW